MAGRATHRGAGPWSREAPRLHQRHPRQAWRHRRRHQRWGPTERHVPLLRRPGRERRLGAFDSSELPWCLELCHYCDTEASFGAADVKAVTDEGLNWTLIEPQRGYDRDTYSYPMCARRSRPYAYLVRLADVLDINPMEAAPDKLAKNEEMYPADQVRGKALKYADYSE